jgi:phosphatidylserine/phosphatidylglycerophosphate/cardiolipin synthase-like enzyme
MEYFKNPIRFIFPLISFVLIFFSTACKSTPSGSPYTPSIVVKPSGNEDQTEEFFNIFFSEPNSPTAGTYRGGPDSALADAILNARMSVDIAIYHLNLWSIRDALIKAHESGVAVRVVAESDNLDEVEIQEVRNAGIEVLGDRRESLMHNKFVIIDGIEVWTGSMNFTVTGAYQNDNNLIRIRSNQLAENYKVEFDEMFIHDMFGDNIIKNTPHPSLVVDDTQIEIFFSPDDPTAAAIIRSILQAEESVYFLAYSFTSDEIADAMLDRSAEGIDVAGVFEEGQYYSNIGTEFDRFVEAGLAVRLDGNSRNMHHKVIIIDQEIVILGSYNFSSNAENRNDENTLIIHNRDIAEEFYTEFQRVYAIAPDN